MKKSSLGDMLANVYGGLTVLRFSLSVGKH